MDRAIQRCDREIAYMEAELRAGRGDMEGLLQGLQDWSWERRMILWKTKGRKRRSIQRPASGRSLNGVQSVLEASSRMRGSLEPKTRLSPAQTAQSPRNSAVA